MAGTKFRASAEFAFARMACRWDPQFIRRMREHRGEYAINVLSDGRKYKRQHATGVGARLPASLRGHMGLIILDPDQPSPTVTAMISPHIHWVDNRILTVSECRRVCAFPDDFILSGSYSEQYERLGRAVPPPVAAAIGHTIAGCLGFGGVAMPINTSQRNVFTPYRMADVAAVPLNGLKAISTFSGCGGSSLGYRMAGFKVCAALEFDKEAAETYEANFPGTPILREDVRKVTGADLLKAAGLQPGTLDLLDGSPPCASFSTAGKRQKDWGKVKNYSGQKQRTDDLFWEFARLVKQTAPRAFVAENVSGLVKGVAREYCNLILGLLSSQGYRVSMKLLDAAWLGVPQRRQRVFFIGFREDLNIDPVFPRPLRGPEPTLRDALRGIWTSEDAQEMVSSIPPSMVRYLKKMAPGESGDMYFQEVCKDVGRTVDPDKRSWFSLSRLQWEKPANTVQASHGRASACQCVHPEENRRLTIPELRRVCSFPDDFKLTGPFHERWERLGRSVPPFVMQAIAAGLAGKLMVCR